MIVIGNNIQEPEKETTMDKETNKSVEDNMKEAQEQLRDDEMIFKVPEKYRHSVCSRNSQHTR